MTKITYKNLRIQNFLSVGNTVVEIEFQKGINRIDGRNIDNPERKNAVGKSCIINAHFFAIFGETVDKIKNEFVVNNVTNAKGFVELELDLVTSDKIENYVIKRHLKPSKVELWKDGVDITRDSIANTNKYICDLLRTNPTIHRCCDIMTVRDTIPFMAMEAAEKRKFIEDIFSINVFGVMLKDLKKMVSENKNDTSVSFSKVNEIQINLDNLEKQKIVIENEAKEREDILQKRKNELDIKINDTLEKMNSIVFVDINPIQANIDKLDAAWRILDVDIASARDEMARYSATIHNCKSEINAMSKVGAGVKCDKCFQDIPSTHVEHIKTILDDNNRKLVESELLFENAKTAKERSENKKSKIQEKIGELTEEIRKNHLNVQRFDTFREILDQHNESKKHLTEDMETKSASVESFDETIKETKVRLEDETKILADLRQTMSDYDVCKFILGEEGVKSFIVKKLMDLLNNTIEKHIVQQGLSVRCKFDEYFEAIISNNKGKTFSYKNASGAEKKSLDFACAFSFTDMRCKIQQISSNVEFFDEVLDSGVDSVGVVLLLDMIKQRSLDNEGCVYIISHRNEVPQYITGETIELKKENGVTSRA